LTGKRREKLQSMAEQIEREAREKCAKEQDDMYRAEEG
jgi:heme exporter protein D